MSNTKPVAFITGAAGGVGLATAEKLDALGFALWLTDREGSAIDTLASRFPSARITAADLADTTQLETLCQEIETSPGQLEVAFINAGIVVPGSVPETSRSTIAAHLNINLLAAALLDHACAAKMKQQGSGHIVNTLSAAAMVALPGSAAYSASKFGLRGFTNGLAADLKPFGISVSGVYPNAIDTPMLREEAASGGSVLNFLSEPVTADDVADAVIKSIAGKKLEYFVPRGDSLTMRCVAAAPRLMTWFYPLLEGKAIKGRDAYLRKYNLTPRA
ncbi:MAG: SDR family oxidoreductase [Pseudomonadota bacterium]